MRLASMVCWNWQMQWWVRDNVRSKDLEALGHFDEGAVSTMTEDDAVPWA